jgi:CBS domain-containing protein
MLADRAGAQIDACLNKDHQEEPVMTIAAILKRKGYDVASVQPTTTIADVVRLLTDRRIGAVVVRDVDDQLVGILSERDVVHGLAANGAAVLAMRAGQLMTRALKTAAPQTTVPEAMTMMTAGRFRHLPVVESGVLVGIVSIGDIVKARIMEQEHEVDTLKAYVAGV